MEINKNIRLNGYDMKMEIYEDSTNEIQQYKGNNQEKSGPFFSYKDIVLNMSLPSLITDRNLICNEEGLIHIDFDNILRCVNGGLIFSNKYVRDRFFIFARKVEEINPIIFSMSDVFSLFEHGEFKKVVSFRSVIDMFDRKKIIISVLNFDFQRSISPSVLEDLFGFTPAESRLAVLLINGKSVIECAEEIGIRISTAREQLSNLFAKTQTSRQPELVSMLSRLDLLL